MSSAPRRKLPLRDFFDLPERVFDDILELILDELLQHERHSPHRACDDEHPVAAARRARRGGAARARVGRTGDTACAKSSYAVPVVGGQVAFDGLLKTLPEATIDAAGTLVPAASVLGGAFTNLAEGTELRWDPPIAGLEPIAVIAAPGLTGGSSATGYGAVRQLKLYEQVGSATAAQDLFAAKLGHFPRSSSPGIRARSRPTST